MSRRAALMAFALTATLALGGLLAAAASDRRDRAFSLQVPVNLSVASLAPGRTLCQGPITAASRFAGLRLWASPARSLVVTVEAAGAKLAHRAVRTAPTPTGALRIPLGTTIGRGTRFSVCVRNTARTALAFEGGAATETSGQLVAAGFRSGDAIAVEFLRDHPPSLLSLLPTVFHRAALLKLSGVGPWTFWVLLAALVGGFALAAWAIAAALSEDADGEAAPRAAGGSS